MNRSTRRPVSTRRRKVAIAITSMFVAGAIIPVATACDYCDQGDGGIVCDTACDSCDGMLMRKPSGPVFKALDKFAGGIEKLFGLDKCGACDAGCDDACDAAMIEDLMIPMEVEHHYSQPVLPRVPAEDYQQPLEGFSQPLMTTQPKYIEPVSPEPAPLPPMRYGEPEPVPNLNNPFSDDEVRLTPPQRSLPTGSHRRSAAATQPSPSLAKYLNEHAAALQAKQPPLHQHRADRQHRVNQIRPATQQRSKGITAQSPSLSPQQVQLSEAPTPKRPVSMVQRTSAQLENDTYSTGRSVQIETMDYFAR